MVQIKNGTRLLIKKSKTTQIYINDKFTKSKKINLILCQTFYDTNL